jgi:hypothetical protein
MANYNIKYGFIVDVSHRQVWRNKKREAKFCRRPREPRRQGLTAVEFIQVTRGQSDRGTKWPGDKATGDKVTRDKVTGGTKWPGDKVTGEQVTGDKMTGGQSDRGQSDRGQSDRGQSDRGQSDQGTKWLGHSDRGQSERGQSVRTPFVTPWTHYFKGKIRLKGLLLVRHIYHGILHSKMLKNSSKNSWDELQQLLIESGGEM